MFKPFNFTKTSSNITFTYSEDGSINCNGTSNGNALSMYTSDSTPYLITLSAGTYTISGNTDDIRLEVLDSSGNSLCTTSTTNNFTINSITKVFVRANILSGKTINNIKIYPQLEQNSQVTSYEPYGKVWYVEKNTRKLELAIADMNNNENYPGWIAYDEIKQLRKDVYNGIIANALGFYTNYYTNIATNNSWVSVNFNSANEPTLYLGRGYWGSDHTQTYWKTNYPNLIVTLIYGLQTPEYTEITNTELIEDLETFYTAKSQEGTTNISITSEDLEMILNVSALKGDA